jgi:hypothetical protein
VAERPAGYEPADLVGEYLLDLTRQGRDSVHRLLAGDDAALQAAVCNRLRQLAVEAGPRWDIYRGLLRLVERVLESGVLATPAVRPPTLDTGRAGKLSPRRIAAAVAFLLDRPSYPLRGDASVIARELMRDYYWRSEPLENPDAHPQRRTGPSSTARRKLDGRRLGMTLEAHLPPAQLDVLLRRYPGESIPSIARHLGIGVATVSSYQTKAVKTLQKILNKGGLSSSAMTYALEELAGYRERSDR